jgi:hypothetical protein
MNTSNYSEMVPKKSYSYGSPLNNFRSSGYSFNESIASNSNGFYPTAVSTPAYDTNNPNAKITSKADEMLRRTEEMSRKHSMGSQNNNDMSNIKSKLDLSDNRMALIGKANVSLTYLSLIYYRISIKVSKSHSLISLVLYHVSYNYIYRYGGIKQV